MNKAAIVQKSMDWDTSMTEILKKSNKRAWLVSGVSWAITALSVAAIAMLVPLKTVEPFLVKVDSNTGATTAVIAMKDNPSFDDVMTRYWLTQYVQKRESYLSNTVRMDYKAVGLMSTAEVARPYAQDLINRQKEFGTTVTITPKILNIVTSASKTNPREGIATVRFERSELRAASVPLTSRWIATISYQYTNEKVDADDLAVNPARFKVDAYKVDQEFVQ